MAGGKDTVPSDAHLLFLQAAAALTQGTSTANFSSDVIRLLYMRIYGITFAEADARIGTLLSWLSVAILVGSMVASFGLAALSKRLGFRNAAAVGIVGCVAFNALQCVAVSPYFTLCMRLLSGYFQTTFTASTLVLVGNAISVGRRGVAGVSFQLYVCAGMVWAGLVLLLLRYLQSGRGTNLYWLSFCSALVFPLAALAPMLRLPRDGAQGPRDEAAPALLTLRDILRRPYLKLSLVSVMLGLVQQLTGINAIIIYATETFKNTFAGSLSSVYGSLIVAAANLLGVLLALPLIERLGRRLLLLGGIGLCVLSTAMMMANYLIRRESTALLLTASAIFLVGFEVGPGSVFFVYAGELFPERGKGVFSSLLQVFNFMPNLLVVLLFPYLTAAAKYLPFLTYLVGMLVCGGVLLVAAPETRGRTREQIDLVMVGAVARTEDEGAVPAAA